jgi:hypothetical protein
MVFVSCQDDSLDILPIEDPSSELNVTNSGESGNENARQLKIDICHNDSKAGSSQIINVSINAWKAHEAHGDIRLDDQDGDGFVPENACGFGQMGDIDDNDATVYPGAPEVCDGKDNDGNGLIDDNAGALYYRDADGDGFGDANVSQQSCIPLEGFVTDNTDCNDSEASAYPGAEEICGDGIDNDCDGLVDEDCGNPDLIENLNEGDLISHDFRSSAFDRTVGQTFTTGATPKELSSISVKFGGPGNGGIVFMELYEIDNAVLTKVATSLQKGIFPNTNNFVFNTNPVLDPNRTYAFILRNTGLNFFGVVGKADANAYGGGTMFYTNRDATNLKYLPQAFDVWFQINLQ